MAMIDGRLFAEEKLMDIAGYVAHAYFKAPQVTSRLDLKAVIISGEEMMPMIELVEKMDQKMSDAVRELFFPLYVDYMCFKSQMENGYSPVCLVLGADLSRSEMGWDCGACGFATCNEFNKYSKESGGIGTMGAGPSCAWKNLDYGVACDYACAAAQEYNVENRILGTFGAISYVLGYLEDVSMSLVLPLGPPVELWWYNRPSLAKWRDYEEINAFLRNNYTVHYQMFSTRLRPQVKKDGPWWEQDREFTRVQPDPQYTDKQFEARAALMETALEVRPKVEEFKERMQKRAERLLKKE